MMTIHYTATENESFDFRLGAASKSLFEMITGKEGIEGEHVSFDSDSFTDAATDMTPLKELCAVIALEMGAESVGTGFFLTHATWPFDVETIMQSVPMSAFLDSLFENGLDSVKISPVQLLAIAQRIAVEQSSDRIEDEHVLAAACAFYSSFDERFQSVFYPSSYCLKLASNSATLFELSSVISKSIEQTKIFDVSPTSLWLSMLVQEPVPSLLYDFLSKTKQSTGIRDDVPEEREEIGSMSDMCHAYVNELMPLPVDLKDASFADSVFQMVADVVSATPASVKDIVAVMLESQGKGHEEIDCWMEYCRSVEESCDFSDVPLVYYPDYAVLSPNGIDAAAKLLSDSAAPIRRILASAALVSFLEESLEGGAPDLVRLYQEDIASGMSLVQYDRVYLPGSMSEEDLNVIQDSRKLSHFGMPTLFQQVVIANMVSRQSSIVSLEDLVKAVDPQNAIMLLSDDVSPYTAHAGVSRDAAKVLAVVESIMRRLSITMALDQKSAMRLYASFLATALATFQALPDKCCSESDQWIMSTASAAFDPRIHVFFSGQETSWEIPLMNAPHAGHAATAQGNFNSQSNPMPYLTALCTDMVALAKEGKIGEGVVGRDNEIGLVETILSRRDKSNPLLLAPAGAGKSAIVESIAWKIANGQANLLNSCNLYQLDLSDLVADGCTAGVMADRLENIVKEAIATNTILFIDEVHMIVSVGHGEMNAGNIMKPYLARGGLKLIGATTEREYNYTISKDKALARRFSAIHLPALSFDALLSILNEKQSIYGQYHGIEYDEKVPRSIIQLSKDYMMGKESPDRELDVLDTSAAVACQEGAKKVEEKHVIHAVRLLTSNKSVHTTKEIAAELIQDYTKEKLDELFPQVAGQYAAKEKISRRIMEAKLDISARRKPRNIFMFVGESGVGKTYMAHEMASLLEIDESDVMTLNLGEFQDHSHTRLIGSSPQYVGYHEGGVLTNFLKAHPHGVVVFDEFDKAFPSIKNVLLGMFDNGVLQAGDGSDVDCKSATFICTANTGYGVNKPNTLGFATAEDEKKKQTEAVMDALKQKFGAALMSRIDELVLFEELDDEDMVEICRISYRKLAKRLLERHEVDIVEVYTEEDLVRDAKQKLSDMEDDNKHDARAIWNEIEKEIIPKAIALIC